MIKVWIPLLSICLLTSPTISIPAPDSQAPNIPDMTKEEVAAKTGYKVEQIETFFPPIETWGRLGVKPAPDKIADSFARDRFLKGTEPYVHPRVYFGPDDLPRIRKHLKTSCLARIQMELMRGRCLQISPCKEDWENIPYAAGDVKKVKGDYLAREIRINRRMGYHGPWVGGWVNDLAEGKDPVELSGKWHENSFQSRRQYLMHLMPYEALRCLIDEDEAGGKRLAAALVTACGLFGQHMDKYGPAETNWQRIYQHLGSESIGLSYDWVYPWMTEAQRSTVRKFIADITRGKTFLGLDQLPGYPGNTSNWIIIHMNLLPLILSIQGEQGYDEMVYRRCMEGMRKWVYVSVGPLGAPFEGFNKSTYAPQWLIPLAKQGIPFIGTEYSRNVIRKYTLHTMLPWGRASVFETGIGLPRDVRPIKYAHPKDPVIDLVYGAAVEKYLHPDSEPAWRNIRTTYSPGYEHIFINDDPIGLKNGVYDYDARFDRVMEHLRTIQEPLSYYSDYRGVFTARTGWDRDAVFLFFEPRNVPGGHSRDSRNEFILASHGRLWATRTEAVEDTSPRHSVILIDGKGMGHQCPQGQTVAFADLAQAAFAVGDARWAYSYRSDTRGSRIEDVTPNDSRIKPGALPWMAQPWGMLPAWNTGVAGGARQNRWSSHNPVEYAYRTAGLVRGKHPYVLITDDYKKDGKPHLFEWLMQIQDDVNMVRSGKNRDGSFSMILGDKDQRRLLLYLVSAGDGKGVSDALAASAKLDVYRHTDKNNVTLDHRVVLPMEAVHGRYRVVLIPFREAETLPRVQYYADRSAVHLSWGDQEDRIVYVPHKDGRTRVTVERNGREILRTD